MEMARNRVAILEDDPDCRNLLRFGLRSNYEVQFARNGAELLNLVESGLADIVLLDVRLPCEDGFAIARLIRRSSSVPIVFVSGLDEENAIVGGLELGADDYVTKPFSLPVLDARIRKVLRRQGGGDITGLDSFPVGKYRFAPHRQQLIHPDGRMLHLTVMESRLLHILVGARGIPVSREELFRQIHDREWDQVSRELDVHVSNLRRKLREAFGIESALFHVRGVGYRLNSADFDGRQ